MELRDLYDENKNLTGETIYKGEEIPDGKFLLVVVVWMQNDKGELLMQQRSFNKETAPGKWATTGGHPKAGENSVEGIVTEIKEEIGITVNKEDLKLISTIEQEQNIVDIYYMKANYCISEMTLQEDEVEKVEWMSLDKIEELIEKGETAETHYKIYDAIKQFLVK